MKIKQTILIFALFIGAGSVLVSQPVLAGTCGGVTTSVIDCGEKGTDKSMTLTCSDADSTDAYEGSDPSSPDSNADSAAKAGYLATYGHNYGSCPEGSSPVETVPGTSLANHDLQKTGIWGMLRVIINIMTAGIGITAVGGLLYGGILYASSGGSPDNVKKAKTIITDIVIGLVAYALMFAFLNFIIPGGLFS